MCDAMIATEIFASPGPDVTYMFMPSKPAPKPVYEQDEDKKEIIQRMFSSRQIISGHLPTWSIPATSLIWFMCAENGLKRSLMRDKF